MLPLHLRALYRACLYITITLATAAVVTSGPARAGQAVDLQLVIAADVSTSMDREEKTLQQQGFVLAFRDPELIRMMLAGPEGRISVTYFEWGGDRTPKLVVPWTVIDSPQAALAFAQRLERNFPSRLPRGTSIGMALDYSSYLLQSSGYDAGRNVVNLSGDGVNNNVPDVEETRARLLDMGTTINGMPIVYKSLLQGVLDGAEDDFPPEYLIDYYRNEVIGGPGAFVEPVTARQNYSAAILRKLIREIGANRLTIGSMDQDMGCAPHEAERCAGKLRVLTGFATDPT